MRTILSRNKNLGHSSKCDLLYIFSRFSLTLSLPFRVLPCISTHYSDERENTLHPRLHPDTMISKMHVNYICLHTHTYCSKVGRLRQPRPPHPKIICRPAIRCRQNDALKDHVPAHNKYAELLVKIIEGALTSACGGMSSISRCHETANRRAKSQHTLLSKSWCCSSSCFCPFYALETSPKFVDNPNVVHSVSCSSYRR